MPHPCHPPRLNRAVEACQLCSSICRPSVASHYLTSIPIYFKHWLHKFSFVMGDNLRAIIDQVNQHCVVTQEF
jgi:hypothetical protein